MKLEKSTGEHRFSETPAYYPYNCCCIGCQDRFLNPALDLSEVRIALCKTCDAAQEALITKQTKERRNQYTDLEFNYSKYLRSKVGIRSNGKTQ